MSTYLHNNLKVLRGMKGHSCDVVANAIGIRRSSLSGYENGAAEPNCSTLLAIGAYYRISLDVLLAQDLTTWPVSSIEELQRGY